MTPDKKVMINGVLVEKYYWSRQYVCYVDHIASRFNFDKSCELLRVGKTKEFLQEKP